MTLDGYDVLLGRLRMNGDYITDRLKEGDWALGSRSGRNVVERPLGNYTREPWGPEHCSGGPDLGTLFLLRLYLRSLLRY